MPSTKIALICWAVALLLGLQGCSSTPQTASNTPWNVPQPWEGSIPLPTGLGN